MSYAQFVKSVENLSFIVQLDLNSGLPNDLNSKVEKTWLKQLINFQLPILMGVLYLLIKIQKRIQK